jgi:hypothetical protein
MLRQRMVCLKTTHWKTELLALLILLALVFAIFAPMMRHMIWERGFDYPLHIQFAREMRTGARETLPHPLFHFLFIGVSALFGDPDWRIVGYGIGVGLHLIIGLVLYLAYVRPVWRGESNRRALALAIMVTLISMLVSAVNLFSWAEGKLYWGYLMPNIYLNPTYTILKPLALLLFIYIAGAFSTAPHFRSPIVVLIALVLTILSGMAKPNYAMAFLPVLGLTALYRGHRRQRVNWALLIIGILLPATITLAVQTFALSSSSVSGGQIAFQPFYLFTLRGITGLLPKFLLSILFPLAVYSLYFKRANRDIGLNLAWLIFAVGAFYSYTLIETERVGDGNFVWSGQITLAVLFIVSTTFFLRQIYTAETGFRLNRAALVCAAALTLHLIGGLFWYYADLDSPGFKWY